MKFEIKNRFTPAVLFTCELPEEIAGKPLGEQALKQEAQP